jgi:transcriptional regulator with XRE-family HTH domain
MSANFKEALISEGLSQAELSRISEVSNTTIIKLLNGDPSIKDTTKGKIVKALNKFVGFEKYHYKDLFK